MAKVIKLDGGIGDPDLSFYCPGCKCNHGIWLKKDVYSGPTWSFNGDMDKPTFSPSLLVRYDHYVPSGAPADQQPLVKERCHTFITDGKIQYLGDCTHELAGQIIELPEIE